MALKRYVATSVASGGDSTITYDGKTVQMVTALTVPASSDCAIVNYTLNGGPDGGLVIIAVYRNSAVHDKIQLSIAPGDCAFITLKEFLEANDILRFGCTGAGATLAVSCDVSSVS